MIKEIEAYFRRQYELYKAKVESGQLLGRMHNAAALADACSRLESIATILKNKQDAAKYQLEENKYNALVAEYRQERNKQILW
jgi:hypothetical protein